MTDSSGFDPQPETLKIVLAALLLGAQLLKKKVEL